MKPATVRILLYLITSLFSTATFAQCGVAEELAHTAYLNPTAKNYAAAVEHAQSLSTSVDNLFLLASLANQAATMMMITEDWGALDNYLDITEKAIDDLWQLDDRHPGAHGLYSGYLGLRIAQSPMKGIIYGSKAKKYAAKGVKLGPENTTANYFLGSNYFYTPETWGGDPQEARRYLKIAVELLPAKPAACDWLSLQTLALYGQSLAKTGDPDSARQIYLRALQLEPGFNYVKYELLPALDRVRK